MKHFIAKLIETPKLEDPFENELYIHKHFTRYSKGEFNGPAVKISKTSKTITIKGTYEVEDELLRIALDLVSEENLKIKGVIMSGDDFTQELKDLGFEDREWFPTRSSGKTKKFQTKITSPIQIGKDKIRKLITKDALAHFNTFLSFTSQDKKISIKTKTKPPQPSRKNPDDDSSSPKVDFCVLKIPFSEQNYKRVLNGVAEDLIDEIPEKYRTILIQTSYNIDDLQLPDKKDVKNSREFRLKTIRKGIMTRYLIKTNNIITKNKIEFEA